MHKDENDSKIFPASPPKFSLRDLRKAIPEDCFQRDTARSVRHLVKNLLFCGSLMYAATCFSWLPSQATILLWPVYWFIQGSLLTGLWIIGHECGHHAFSPHKALNDVVGISIHSFFLVPYFSWQISHRRHHANTGSCENDEVFVPLTKSEYTKHKWSDHFEDAPLFVLLRLVTMHLVGWIPGYLIFNATGPSKYRGKPASHFNPHAAIFSSEQARKVVVSDVAVAVAAAILVRCSFSWPMMIKLYWVPFMVVNCFVVLVTFLQHTDTFVPHLRAGKWTWLHGALCTVDRDFGWFLNTVFHHVTDTHVCHHIFPQIPFYHAVAATAAIRPLLGPYYLKDSTPILVALWRAFTHCRFVEDEGDIVFYKKQ